MEFLLEELLPFLPMLMIYGSPLWMALAARYWAKNRHRLRLRRKLRSHHPVKLEDSPEGAVQVTGMARALGPPLTTPLGHHQVLGYRLIIGKQHRSRGGIEVFTVLLDEHAGSPFIIDDGTGTMLVESQEWRLFATDQLATAHFARPGQVPRLVARRLRQLNQNPDDDVSGDLQLFAVVQGIKDGDRISILGTATREVDPEALNVGYREPPLKTVIRSGGGDAVYLTSGRPEDIGNARTAKDEIKVLASFVPVY